MAKPALVKDVNLLLSLNKKPRKIEKKKSSALSVTVIILLILIMGGIYSYILFQNIEVQNEIDDIKSYISSQDVREQKDYYDVVFEESVKLNVARLELEEIYKTYHTERPFNINVINQINSCMIGDSYVSSYNYFHTEREVKLVINSSQVININAIVKNIISNGILENVEYNGYQLSGDGVTFDFNVTGIIKGGE